MQHEPPKPMTSILDADGIQFPRLLAEIYAAGLTDEQMDFLCESTDLTRKEIEYILNRADLAWEDIKRG